MDPKENCVGGLKLRVTHLHPDNPALSSSITQHREILKISDDHLDKVCSFQDLILNSFILVNYLLLHYLLMNFL